MFDTPATIAQLTGGQTVYAEERRDRTIQPLYGGQPTSTKIRRIELRDGEEAMLLQLEWTFDGPSNFKDTELGKYWINPRSKRRYTQRAAVDIEELRDSLSRIYIQKTDKTNKQGSRAPGFKDGGDRKPPPRRNRQKNFNDKTTPAERQRKYRNKI